MKLLLFSAGLLGVAGTTASGIQAGAPASPVNRKVDDQTETKRPGLSSDTPKYEMHTSPEDAEFVETFKRYVAAGVERSEKFFGAPFPKPFDVRLLPDRKAFTAFFRKEWGISETQCWWVAAGVGEGLVMLSPRAWKKEACEHDATDSTHVRGIVFHELVHVFHGQRNAKVEELEGIGWFVEGLAAYASGQLENRHRTAARTAIESGVAPKRLAKAWSGPHRYGVSGSLVKYIDETFGRDTVIAMLKATSQAEALGMIKLSEEELLARWREYVLARR